MPDEELIASILIAGRFSKVPPKKPLTSLIKSTMLGSA
jgi:hypothetical protein